MKRHSIIILTFTAVLAVATIGSVAAKGHRCMDDSYGGGYGQGHWAHSHNAGPKHHMLEHLVDRLDLSAEQSEQVEQIVENTLPQRGLFKPHMMPFIQLDPASADYEAQLNLVIEQKSAIMKQHMLAMGLAKQQVFNILTPEQQEAFYELQEKALNRFK